MNNSPCITDIICWQPPLFLLFFYTHYCHHSFFFFIQPYCSTLLSAEYIICHKMLLGLAQTSRMHENKLLDINKASPSIPSLHVPCTHAPYITNRWIKDLPPSIDRTDLLKGSFVCTSDPEKALGNSSKLCSRVRGWLRIVSSTK